MIIDRNNYFLWISDFYDGVLSDAQKEELHKFLSVNPDLKEEFNEFKGLVIYPDISDRIDKTSLRKEIVDLNQDDLDQYAIALAENDLDPEFAIEIAESLSSTEEGLRMIEDYQKIRLSPQQIIYPARQQLKRIPARVAARRLLLPVLSAAATIAILITILLFIPHGNSYPVKYNSAYLLPFNNSASGESASGFSFTGLAGNRISPKQINIRERDPQTEPDSLPVERIDEPALTRVASLDKVSISTPATGGELLQVSLASPEIAGYRAENLSPRQFVAMNLRKHVLKEDVENVDKLKVYEVADITVGGLNKLLGWEMQFEKEKSTDGRLASFKFTSQLINLDHKMKNVTEEL